jgi:hypothetical protein
MGNKHANADPELLRVQYTCDMIKKTINPLLLHTKHIETLDELICRMSDKSATSNEIKEYLLWWINHSNKIEEYLIWYIDNINQSNNKI